VTAEPGKRRGRPPAGGREAILVAALELLRERGIARLTTREVAKHAGVSEGSVFYHYGDRTGLLKAVFEQGVRPLQGFAEDAGASRLGLADFLTTFGGEVERFLDQTLPVIAAAQSDAELRDALGAYMDVEDLGPHRGVRTLSSYLASGQTVGLVRSDVDPDAVALMFVGSCFLRASQRQMPAQKVSVPPLEEVIAAFVTLLKTDGAPLP
jgi:AcrR family transcriptional regulator